MNFKQTTIKIFIESLNKKFLLNYYAIFKFFKSILKLLIKTNYFAIRYLFSRTTNFFFNFFYFYFKSYNQEIANAKVML